MAHSFLRTPYLFVLLHSLLASEAWAQSTSGSFNVLSYNVAGLPDILSSGDPAVNTPFISQRLGPYNIINVQEDFNYHAALYASDSHAYRTPTSGGAAIGSGLNSLSNFPYIDLERVTWDDCNLNSGDCLTPKGFTFARVQVASPGVYVDLYNLHTDAGSDDGDRTARASNLGQVTSFINTWSAGMPVIVMGDTNSRYTNDVDGTSLRSFLSSNGFVDSWVKNTRSGTPPTLGSTALVCPFPFAASDDELACEVVDKIFVRGSPVVTLSPTSYANENQAFLNSSGYPLSDHYPISSKIQWSLGNSLRLGESSGGPHGDPFNDIPSVISGQGTTPKLKQLTLRAGNRVDGLSYTLDSSSTAVTHGGTGGTAQTLTLASGETIVEVTSCWGTYSDHTRIFYLNFKTSTGRTLEGGTKTSDCLTGNIPTGSWGLVGFFGRQGEEIDRIAPIWGSV